jgi:hypothetical protein
LLNKQNEQEQVLKMMRTMTGGKSLAVLRIHIRAALQQQTANIKMAVHGRVMQWCVLAGSKQKK